MQLKFFIVLLNRKEANSDDTSYGDSELMCSAELLMDTDIMTAHHQLHHLQTNHDLGKVINLLMKNIPFVNFHLHKLKPHSLLLTALKYAHGTHLTYFTQE